MTKENFDELVQEFIGRAGVLHDSTNQKYDDKPYSFHTTGVANIALEYCDYFTDNLEVRAAIVFGAAFHDTIEDARLTYNDVMKIAKEYFSDELARTATEIVYALTNEKGRTRDERANDKYYFGIVITPYAPFVKLCDRLFNMRYSKDSGSRMFKKYCDELNHFFNSIRCNAGEDDEHKPYSFPPNMLNDLAILKNTKWNETRG